MERDLDSGEKWRELSVKYDPDTSSWKTHRCLFEEGLPESSVTLPRWGMMLNGVVYRRKTSDRPIEGTGSGWLPTPSASSYGSNQGGAAGREGKIRHSLETMAKKSLWPTPTVQDGNGRTHHNQRDGSKTLSLLGVVQNKPVMTCDCGHTFEFISLSEPCPYCDSIRSGSVTYPTPCATDADKGGRGELLGFVRGTKGYRGPLIPNPTASDGKGGPGHGKNCQGGEYLRTTVGGSLNADWVELLMSWPKGWTSLEPLKHINEDWFTWPADWERGVPRVVKNQPNRAKRLKAIGNGQVPIAAAVAWVVLNERERPQCE